MALLNPLVVVVSSPKVGQIAALLEEAMGSRYIVILDIDYMKQ
jgi:hypothetical protein